ncbi:hypothetical protein M422DRAFT_45066 [Sphaerobolus stellatus SS14]|nr:hypothetical protein M422DRAFT_45066 [Sphaerobolus stellatus SS14]
MELFGTVIDQVADEAVVIDWVPNFKPGSFLAKVAEQYDTKEAKKIQEEIVRVASMGPLECQALTVPHRCIEWPNDPESTPPHPPVDGTSFLPSQIPGPFPETINFSGSGGIEGHLQRAACVSMPVRSTSLSIEHLLPSLSEDYSTVPISQVQPLDSNWDTRRAACSLLQTEPQAEVLNVADVSNSLESRRVMLPIIHPMVVPLRRVHTVNGGEAVSASGRLGMKNIHKAGLFVYNMLLSKWRKKKAFDHTSNPTYRLHANHVLLHMDTLSAMNFTRDICTTRTNYPPDDRIHRDSLDT